MKLIFLKVTLGVALTGCTINNLHFSNVELKPTREVTLVEKPVTHSEPKEHKVETVTVVAGNKSIRPECEVYKPLPIPEPIKVDFKELEAATTTKEINGIALRNVGQLHNQLKNYAEASTKHYEEYKKRCVLNK